MSGFQIGDTDAGALFVGDGSHRLTLWRRWVPQCPTRRMVAFVGVNPSTADAEKLDPTNTRCVNFAKDWGFDGYIMLNLFSIVSTDPQGMLASDNPNWVTNTLAILHCTHDIGRIVCAWGVHGQHQGRGTQLAELLRRVGRKLHHLGLNRDGTPKHPLYLRRDTVPVLWE